jgi:anti-sigma B factor antagonist
MTNRENDMDKMNPNLSIKFFGTIVVATLTDEKILDEQQLQNLEGSFIPLIEQNDKIQLIVDFSNVQFLTSSVLGLLIRVSKKVYETDGVLRLCSINPKILEVFKITRLDKIFEIFPSADDAAVGLKKS